MSAEEKINEMFEGLLESIHDTGEAPIRLIASLAQDFKDEIILIVDELDYRAARSDDWRELAEDRLHLMRMIYNLDTSSDRKYREMTQVILRDVQGLPRYRPSLYERVKLFLRRIS